jgi:hypothetical protein
MGRMQGGSPNGAELDYSDYHSSHPLLGMLIALPCTLALWFAIVMLWMHI